VEDKISRTSAPGAEKMSQPLVSVALVVSNVDRFLAESIESILGQTFRDFEFIIVDFGSTDNSKSIISKYAAIDSRVKFHEIPHCGLAEARNAACSLAEGKYIAIMDADDVSVPERLSWQAEFMENHPEVGVVGGSVERIDATSRPLQVFQYPLENREIQSELLTHCVFCQPTVLMRRDAFVRVGGYRGPFAPAEDYDLWLRIAESFQLANLVKVVLKYRIHSSQVTLRKRRQQIMGSLAAQASARARRNGGPDPLNRVKEITPALLAGLGVTKPEQQVALAREYLNWTRVMYQTREYSGALNALNEILQPSDREYAESWVVAELRFLAAGIYWRQRRFLRSVMTLSLAVAARPLVVGRPLKLLLRWVRLRTAAVGTCSLDSRVQR
jgi:cellulose synthase/poly-beta-1,6-N-acetylglucosamine synthase-like glycosyltransferase